MTFPSSEAMTPDAVKAPAARKALRAGLGRVDTGVPKPERPGVGPAAGGNKPSAIT